MMRMCSRGWHVSKLTVSNPANRTALNNLVEFCAHNRRDGGTMKFE